VQSLLFIAAEKQILWNIALEHRLSWTAGELAIDVALLFPQQLTVDTVLAQVRWVVAQ
jgi:hypothetical protein